jgi:predicted transposase/invertase (TIGR01784 family)
MAKLEYTFKNDTLFKTLFVQYPDLLKRLTAELLGVRLESIGQFAIINPDIPPEVVGDKFCRLDINMEIDGQRVDLEIQVHDEGDYPERSLYYWAREYSASLSAGVEYVKLPRVVIISIVAFNLFDCAEFHSEFQALEITRHSALTDKMCLHYFELPKLPKTVAGDDELKLWLALFSAETEEELKRLEELGAPVMEQAIMAYRGITATDEFKELERQRSYAAHNKASALEHARREGERIEREKWQGVVANKDAALADKDAMIAQLKARLGESG